MAKNKNPHLKKYQDQVRRDKNLTTLRLKIYMLPFYYLKGYSEAELAHLLGRIYLFWSLQNYMSSSSYVITCFW